MVLLSGIKETGRPLDEVVSLGEGFTSSIHYCLNVVENGVVGARLEFGNSVAALIL